jgi:DNA-binding NarL/FixJ family response regulator
VNITAFLVDDHSVVRDGLKLLLETQPDIKVVGDAANGRDAIHKIAKLNPHVVIMDIFMPELNGIEATRKVLEVCPSTKIVILSMYSTPEHIFQGLHAGASGYILKESAGSEVVDAIRSVYKGKRYLSEKISGIVIDEYVKNRQSDESKSPLARLSQREREILQLLAEGKTNGEIAGILFVSPKTIETYRSRLMHKLSINDLPSLVKFAILHGLTLL